MKQNLKQNHNVIGEKDICPKFFNGADLRFSDKQTQQFVKEAKQTNSNAKFSPGTLWCDFGCCSLTVVDLKAAVKPNFIITI